MFKHRYLLPSICILGAALLTFAARAQDVVESSRGETTEKQLPSDEPLRPWTVDPNLLQKEAGDRVEMRPVHAERLATVKLTDVVPPIRFDSGVADISQSYIESLRKALDDLRDRRNVRLHLIGHADDQPLSESTATMKVFRASVPARLPSSCKIAWRCRPRRSRTSGPAPRDRSLPIRRRKAAP